MTRLASNPNRLTSPSTIAKAASYSLSVERLATSPDESTHRLADDAAALAEVLLYCATGALVEFRALPSRFVVQAGNRPKASGLARWQSLYFDSVTALSHWSLQISGMERFILRHLDGANDRAQLVRLTERAFATGDLQLDGAKPTREQLADVLNDVLFRLGRLAVLVA